MDKKLDKNFKKEWEKFWKGMEKKVDLDFIGELEYDDDSWDSFDSVYERFQNNGLLNVEVIYYSNAISYLSKADPSLNQSLEIANDLGFSIDNLNSEVLASLLQTQELEEEFQELRDEIDTFLEDYWERYNEAENED